MYNTTAEFAALLCVVLCVMAVSAKRQCDENGRCKYGGWCDTTTNTCRCHFKCSEEQWSTTYYCGPLKHGYRKYFRNLCKLAAYACEKQENIPIIRVDVSKPYSEMCTREEPHALCSEPEDFMGRCGSFYGPKGNLDAGICLQDTYSQKRCQCPSSKMGYNCETRIKVRSVGSPSGDEPDVVQNLSPGDGADNRVARIAVFAGIAFVATAACVALFVKRYVFNRRQPLTNENHPIEFKARPHNLADSLRDARPKILTSPSRERHLAVRQTSRQDVSVSFAASAEINENRSHGTLAVLTKPSDDVCVNLCDDVTRRDV